MTWAIRENFIVSSAILPRISVLSVVLPILADGRTSWDGNATRKYYPGPIVLGVFFFVFAVGLFAIFGVEERAEETNQRCGLITIDELITW